jgi:hypothetical protein
MILIFISTELPSLVNYDILYPEKVSGLKIEIGHKVPPSKSYVLVVTIYDHFHVLHNLNSAAEITSLKL